MKLLLPLLLMMQVGVLPTPDSVNQESIDYGAALSRWSMCADLAIMGGKPKLISKSQIKALLAKNCAAEAQDFEAKITAFIMIDGDPKATAAPIARAEAEQVGRDLVQDMAAKLQRRVLMRDTVAANKWIACLKAAKSSCADEEGSFTTAAGKALKADGLSDGDANAIITQFVKRTRQRVLNGVD